MRLNLAVLAVTGATMLAATGCDVGPSEESPNGPLTVTEMTQLPDGTWKTTATHAVPAGYTVRPPGADDGVEAKQSAFQVNWFCGNWNVAVWSGTNFGGSVVCYNRNCNGQKMNLPFTGRSVYTTVPVALYNSSNAVVFSWNSFSQASNGALSPATQIQELATDQGFCHF